MKLKNNLVRTTNPLVYLLIVFALAPFQEGWGQTQLVLDNFGTTAQNPISRTGWTANSAGGSNWELRITSPSSSYSWTNPAVSASGGANVFTNLGTNTNTKQLTYSNSLSTVNYSSIMVRFGGVKSGTTPNLVVLYSTDGTTYNNAGSVTLTTSWAAYTVSLPAATENVSNLRIRFEIVANSNTANNIRIDDFHVIGTYTVTNDQTSKVAAPATQTAAGDIASTATSGGSAVDVFKFKISDLATADALSTKVTQVRIKKSSGTADWTDHIAGASLWDGATQITTGTVAITDADITFPITSGNLDIGSGSNKDITLKIWLNTANIVDNSTMVFTVSQTSHGFTADATGSGFASDFGAAVTGNTMTVRVASTKLLFTTAPSVTACPNTNLTTPPVVKATDANGMTDTDFTGQITLTNSGGIGMNNYQMNASSGVASFSTLQFTTTGNVTLSSSASGLTGAGPTASITISVGNATSPAATNGNAASVITWTNPSSCIDEIMIVGKAGSAVTLAPSGDGTSYSASLAYGSGTAYDGGFVLYKGSTSSQSVTSLTNGTTYHFTLFTRKGSFWSSGITTTATPVLASSATDHFRSNAATGNWTTASSWQSSVDGSSNWITATLTPTSSANSITVLNGHTLTCDASFSVDQLTVNSGGKIIVNSTRTLTIANGADAFDMVVYGTVECAGNIVVNTGGAVKFESGGYYKHTGNGGTMVSATWDPNTTCEITGMTNATTLANFGAQISAYGNLIWNCTGQTVWLDGAGQFDVAGDFTINSTGGGTRGINLVTAAGTNRYFDIGGDLIINQGKLTLTKSTALATVTIGGNLTIAANSINALDFGYSTSPPSSGIYRSYIYLSGNMNVGTGAIVTTTSDWYGKIVFDKAGEQTFSNAGTITWVDYDVSTGSTLKLASNLSLISQAWDIYTEVIVNGTIDFGTYKIVESSGIDAYFTLSSNATFKTANTAGVNGSLPLLYYDLYSDANYIFNGTADQVTGTKLTDAKNIDLSNTAGKVSLSGNVAVSGTLTIPTGNILDAASFVISGTGDIDLQSGGTIRTSHTSGLNGNNTTTGGLTDFSTGASYVYYGTAAQVTGSQLPATIYNFTVDNSGGVSLSNTALTVSNNLTINTGKLFNIDAGKQVTVQGNLINNGDETSLIIKSNASGTGSLIQGTSDVPATIQRYTTGSTNQSLMQYHLVSIPLDPSENSVTGLFYGSYLFSFDADSNKWDGQGNPTEVPLDEREGYMIYYVLGSSTTYEFPGKMNAADFTPTVVFVDRGASNDEGWNLIPNPYPSAIDWNASGWTKTNIDGTIYFWPAGGSNYSSWNGTTGTGTPAGSRYIPGGQAFFVHANSAAASLVIPASAKVHNTQAFYKNGEADPDNLLRITCYASQVTDELVVHFREDATDDFDTHCDAYKLSGGLKAPQINTVTSDNFRATINSLPLQSGERIIPLNVSFYKDTTLTFISSGAESFADHFPVYLEDKKAGKFIDLKTEPEYTFNYSKFDEDRFNLVFANHTGINVPEDGSFIVYRDSDQLRILNQDLFGQKVRVNLIDISGKILSDKELVFNTSVSIDSPETAGTYIVRIISGNTVVSRKIVIL